MEEFIKTHRAKCPHCLGELEKRNLELGDWYYICVDCKKTVPISDIQFVPIAGHFNHIENNHLKEATLNRVATKNKKEDSSNAGLL